MMRPGWIFNLVTGLAAILCLALAILWARSFSARDVYPALLSGGGRQIQSWEGRVFLIHATTVNIPPRQVDIGVGVGRPPIPRTPGTIMGLGLSVSPARISNGFGFSQDIGHLTGIFGTQGNITRADVRVNVLSMPYWLPLALALTALGGCLMIPLRRRARVAAGLCAVCGYDLRATPDRCPECGTPTGAAAPGKLPSGKSSETSSGTSTGI